MAYMVRPRVQPMRRISRQEAREKQSSMGVAKAVSAAQFGSETAPDLCTAHMIYCCNETLALFYICAPHQKCLTAYQKSVK